MLHTGSVIFCMEPHWDALRRVQLSLRHGWALVALAGLVGNGMGMHGRKRRGVSSSVDVFILYHFPFVILSSTGPNEFFAFSWSSFSSKSARGTIRQ
jgi:hypothetical protein